MYNNYPISLDTAAQNSLTKTSVMMAMVAQATPYRTYQTQAMQNNGTW